MDIETLREYCLSKKSVQEKLPFDESTLAFFIVDKMFALTGLEKPELSINLKCDPEWAIELREEFDQIQPGFHMNKKHWNTVYLEGLEDNFIKKLIDHSYDMVLKGFSRKKITELGL